VCGRPTIAFWSRNGDTGKYYDTVVKNIIEGKWIVKGQRLVGDEACDQITSLLSTLLPCGSTADGWTCFYRDAESGVLWELTYPHGERHGGGPPRLESFSLDELRLKYPDVKLNFL
jgi:hypothetical protein